MCQSPRIPRPSCLLGELQYTGADACLGARPVTTTPQCIAVHTAVNRAHLFLGAGCRIAAEPPPAAAETGEQLRKGAFYRVLYRDTTGQQRSSEESLLLVRTLHTGRTHSNNAATQPLSQCIAAETNRVLQGNCGAILLQCFQSLPYTHVVLGVYLCAQSVHILQSVYCYVAHYIA